MIVSWANCFGLNNSLLFQAPLTDAGAGAANLVLSNGTGSGTFTRAASAMTKLSSGNWGLVALGVARFCYIGNDTTVQTQGGYLPEVAATNLCLQNRDLTQIANWTSTGTALKDQVGIDGVANSASSFAATAGGSAILQTITEAATASALSMFIKRITGTGTITIQQGASTLDVTASVNSSTYTRVELDASVLNPIIGIVLGTNGDKIAVDMVQFENTTSGATSPIPTPTVAVTRNGDVLTYPSSGNAVTTAGTMLATTAIANKSSNPYWMTINDGSTNNRVSGFESTPGAVVAYRISSGGASQLTGTGAGTYPAVMTPVKQAMSWSAAGAFGYLAGVQDKSSGGPITVPAAFTTIGIGMSEVSASQMGGFIKDAKIWASALSGAQIANF